MSEEIAARLRELVVAALPDAKVEVEIGSPGHYSLQVVSAAFEGQRLLGRQRLVFSAISSLMGDDRAPVHAIDAMQTKTPDEA